MKIQLLIKQSTLCLFCLSGLWFSYQSHADGVPVCDSVLDPLVISANCNDLIIYEEKSSVTVNSGVTISSGDIGNAGVANSAATIHQLTNSGVIYGSEIGIYNFGATTNILNNSGIISAGVGGVGINNLLGSITTLNNTGNISIENAGLGILNLNSLITTLNNSGTISVGSDGLGLLMATIASSLPWITRARSQLEIEELASLTMLARLSLR